MLIPSTRSDQEFVASCLDPSRREAALARERRNHSLGVVAFAIAVAGWLIGQWPVFSGAGERSAGDDFMILFIAMLSGWVTLAARSNIRLLLGIQGLEQRRAEPDARA